jgi:hypothetical protein
LSSASSPRRLICVSLAVALGAGSPRAQAQTRDPVAAEALFLAGRDAVERGELDVACPKLAESDKLDPAPGTKINLADCEERVGHPASAWRHWRAALEELPPDDARTPLVKERIALVEKRVPRLTVKLQRVEPGLRVRRDDTELGVASLGIALPVEPGEHIVEVTATGREPRLSTIKLAEGESATVLAEVGAPLPTPEVVANSKPAPRVSPLAAPFPWRTTGWIAIGTGAVALVTTGVAGGVALTAKSDLDGQCFPITVCNDVGAAAASRGRTAATIANVAGVAGAVLVPLGVVLVLTHPHRDANANATSWTLAADARGATLFARFR